MLRRARYCHGKSSVRLSVCLSVCDVEVSWSHRLEYFDMILWLINLGNVHSLQTLTSRIYSKGIVTKIQVEYG